MTAGVIHVRPPGAAIRGVSEGTIELVGDDEKKSAAKPAKRKAAPVRPREGGLGQTLRNVYTQAVNEDIPQEMLDLLGKLS
ncbi:NepR family anti-sigma factor [Sphingomonas jatrophae]|uniref:Anti-sigma factor NepR domain-containing protein n=1 Tax=Sphingomonas jatrophae TaxID=1166337 RepID=A0A1I6JGA6_9SPHN|nr:NepR family anti-sigma factor [Sphingomonas jatrophae]SFR78036.1 hypothetical protein SAMN05192580_0239 [Sphingomonas jatrophae]